MFTGIVEKTGIVQEILKSENNLTFVVKSEISDELKEDQSVMHNGVCLTVISDGKNGLHSVTAIEETLKKTNTGDLIPGSSVNLERSLRADSRIDGHFVQGHVDACGTVYAIKDHDGSREFIIQFPGEFEDLIVPRGSICLNGISLTVADSSPADHTFSVHIIPYTMEVTNMSDLVPEDRVNLEFDILGKYIQKIMSRRV